jgi:thiamine-monophosphate kinase
MHLTSEDSFLALIDRHFPQERGHVVLGRGDDACVVRLGGEVCISTDLFLEGEHFRLGYFGAGDVGWKSLAVNLSDMAAMGAVPLGFTLGLTIPVGVEEDWWDAFFGGMAELAERFGVTLAGGDLSRGERLGVCVTVWGEKEPGGRFLTRGGCEVGDVLFFVGQVGQVGQPGLARVGLLALEERGRGAEDDFPEAVRAHLRPEPLVAEGRLLAKAFGVTALMDLSDGLARDLPRLVGPRQGLGQGSELELGEADLHPEVRRYCGDKGLDAVKLAMLGGEEYGLVGAARPETMQTLQEALPGLRRIGVVGGEVGIRVNGQEFRAGGFDHFSDKA